MFCRNCGAQIMESSKFCPKCGNAVLKKEVVCDEGASPRYRDFLAKCQNIKRQGLLFGTVAGFLAMIITMFIFGRQFVGVFTIAEMVEQEILVNGLSFYCYTKWRGLFCLPFY